MLEEARLKYLGLAWNASTILNPAARTRLSKNFEVHVVAGLPEPVGEHPFASPPFQVGTVHVLEEPDHHLRPYARQGRMLEDELFTTIPELARGEIGARHLAHRPVDLERLRNPPFGHTCAVVGLHM